MSKFSRISIFIAFYVMASNFTNAKLYLLIDQVAKEFSLIGSASGTPGDQTAGIVSWMVVNSSVETFESAISTPGTGQYTATGNTGGAANAWGYESAIQFYATEPGYINFHLVVDNPIPTTITGTGVSVSYATLDATHQSLLESLIGSNMPLEMGTGFGSLGVTVPEPSALYLVTALTISTFWLMRKKNKFQDSGLQSTASK